MLIPILNRLLTHDAPGRAKLAEYAGKTVAFDTPPLALTAQINERGYLIECAEVVAVPDLKITLPLSAMPLAALGKERVLREAKIEGNIALGNAFNALFDALPLAVEQETERFVGPVVAHGLGEMGKRVANGVAALRESVTRNAALALTRGENSMLPRSEDVKAWAYDVNGLAQRLQTLEQRIARLS
jgi:ubiquinone biosynthesis protein UbiJ